LREYQSRPRVQIEEGRSTANISMAATFQSISPSLAETRQVFCLFLLCYMTHGCFWTQIFSWMHWFILLLLSFAFANARLPLALQYIRSSGLSLDVLSFTKVDPESILLQVNFWEHPSQEEHVSSGRMNQPQKILIVVTLATKVQPYDSCILAF
jgi:hypothetical protein